MAFIDSTYPDFLTAVGFGLVPGFRRIGALGNNPIIDSATVPEDIWTNGGVFPFLTGAKPSTIRDAVITTFHRLQNGTYRLPLPISVDGNPHERGDKFGLTVTEKSTFGLRCTFVSANNTNITAGWQGVMRRN